MFRDGRCWLDLFYISALITCVIYVVFVLLFVQFRLPTLVSAVTRMCAEPCTTIRKEICQKGSRFQ